jgi:hypothetical protein
MINIVAMNGRQQDQKNTGGEGHRVLIAKSLVGNFDENTLTHPNAKIVIKHFQDAGRLSDFDVIILPFSEFEISDRNYTKSKDAYKDIFEKQALEALDGGTTFCFVHHNEDVPGPFADYQNSGYSSDKAAYKCWEMQAGFRWIASRKIRIGLNSDIILKADVKRGEFSTFLKKWGATYNYFDTFENGKFDDVLYSLGKCAIGFSIDQSRGMIVYLPFQANHKSPQDLMDGVQCLVDSLLTYKAKRVRELPVWAKEPLFENEIQLAAEKARLGGLLQAIDAQISPYEEAKLLLVANEHNLEVAVPTFILTKLGIPTERDEKFIEDFWILNSQKKKNAICEVKSVTKGFKKSAIYDVYNHREKHDLPDAFPAMLFANCNLQAGSWAKKSVPIQKDDYEIAVKNHVLIIRIEDLVQIWNSLVTKTLTVDAIIKTFSTEVGWLECKAGKIIVHK